MHRPRPRARRRWASVVALVVAGNLAVGACAGPSIPVPSPTSLASPVRPLLATYAGGPSREGAVRADGYRHIDTPTLVAQLRRLHLNTYVFLVARAPDWEDLTQDFLPAAQTAGINVWVYILPPSECSFTGCSVPFSTDYIAWASAVAEQSKTYANLTGWVIDDFAEGTNLGLLTPAYTRRVHDAGARINPNVRFMPLLYSAQITSDFLRQYRLAFDAVVFAFDDAPVHDTQWAETLRPQLDRALALTAGADKPLLLMTYANSLSAAPLLPSSRYVDEVNTTALGYVRDSRLAGLIAYGVPLGEGSASPSEWHARTGLGRLSLIVNKYGRTTVGGYALATQTVQVQPGQAQSLKFWHQNRTDSRKASGLRRLQVLVDDKVMFDHDVSRDPVDVWIHERVVLDAALTGKGYTTLTLRVVDVGALSGVLTDVGVDDLQAHGFTITNPGFETPLSWTLERHGGPFLPSIDIFDTQRPAHVFATIRDLFAGASAP